MNHRYFCEYRPHDYRIPRSMREAYGEEPILWEEEEPPDAIWYAGVMVWAVAVGGLIWYAAGWL